MALPIQEQLSLGQESLELAVLPASDAPILVAKDLRVIYGETLILDMSEFTIKPGLTLIIGNSGAGKSTAVNAMRGVIDVEGSSLEWADHVKRQPDDPRTVIGTLRTLFKGANSLGVNMEHVEQDISVNGSLTAAEQIVYGLQMRDHEVDVDYLNDWAQKLKISHLMDRSPATMSGGERSRFAMLRALASDPDVIFMDEPTASVDPRLTEDIFAMLREVADTDIDRAVVVVTHDTSYEKYAHRVAHFGPQGSEIVEYDTSNGLVAVS